jgi:GNAT superfamily N-acetyltransferase
MRAVEDWMFTVRRMAEPLAGYEEVELPSGRAIWGHVPFALVNQYFLAEAIPDTEGFARWLDDALEFATRRQLPWLLALCSEHMPEGGTTTLAEHGFVPAMSTTYMSTGQLLPPSRPMPSLEFRPITTAAHAATMSDLNCAAYGMPLELGRSAFSNGGLFDRAAYGAIAWSDGEPVSTASVLFDKDCLNVACVATPAHHRRKGYAEATVRHVLEESARRTGLANTVLHATPDGYPVYRRMGYTPSVAINMWSLVEYE